MLGLTLKLYILDRASDIDTISFKPYYAWSYLKTKKQSLDVSELEETVLNLIMLGLTLKPKKRAFFNSSTIASFKPYYAWSYLKTPSTI